MSGQTVGTLHSFIGSDGQNPSAALVQGPNGELYGTTNCGGSGGGGSCNSTPGGGTIFKITLGGKLTVLYNFCSQPETCPDGQLPNAPLLLATNGDFYGTTRQGGANDNAGTVFKITPSGTLTTLYNFCSLGGGFCPDGMYPEGGLVQATNGDLYGVTSSGGAPSILAGTVFKITPSGSFSTLYTFCTKNGCPDGSAPQGGLVQGADGDLYGTTAGGGANGRGSIFKITLGGKFSRLYSFSQSGTTDGSSPLSALVQAMNGELYGTTYSGGTNNSGTVFAVTPAGVFTTLYSFCAQTGCADGGFPNGLVQGTDGNLYGTTSMNGVYSFTGTIYRITLDGTLSTLYSFCPSGNCAGGGYQPGAGLVQVTSGELYGTTLWGGSLLTGDCSGYPYGCGTVFSLSVGLGPFIETVPTSGKAGATVKILGTNLSGTTSVTFNEVSAVFTIISNSEVTAHVPVGATTGTVQVVTPSGTISSHVPFTVP